MSIEPIKLSAYGRLLLIERANEEWVLFNLSTDGKRYRERSIAIPAELDRKDVITYLADLLHEAGNEAHPGVEVIE